MSRQGKMHGSPFHVETKQYKYAIEKGTPVVEKAADNVRKQAVKFLKETEKKIEKK